MRYLLLILGFVLILAFVIEASENVGGLSHAGWFSKEQPVKYRSELVELIDANLDAGDWEVALDDITFIEQELENAGRSTDLYPTLADLRKTAEEQRLYEEVRAIPASELENNLTGYQTLAELNPANALYATRVQYYRDRIRVRDEQIARQEHLAREAEQRRLERERQKRERQLLAESRRQSGGRGYINSRGDWVPSPRHAPSAPAGASARCRDGTYSFSRSRRGTCSHHGGVAAWL